MGSGIGRLVPPFTHNGGSAALIGQAKAHFPGQFAGALTGHDDIEIHLKIDLLEVQAHGILDM
jgi:hypothetical protein